MHMQGIPCGDDAGALWEWPVYTLQERSYTTGQLINEGQEVFLYMS